VGGNFVSAENLDLKEDVYPLRLSLCHDCGYTGLLDVIDPEVLFTNATQATSVSRGMNDHHKNLADQIVAQIEPPEGSLVVDIGSNDGVYLQFFQEHGLRVLGVEPSRLISKKANNAGVETLPAFFYQSLAQQIKEDYGPASIITANRVFANIDNLAEVAKGIRDLLAPDGVFIFETGYIVDLIDRLLIDTIYHEHLGYDAVKPLENFFRIHGLELIDAERVTVKDGSIRGTVQLAGGPRPVQHSVADLIEFEEAYGLERLVPYQEVTQKINREKVELSNLIKELKSSGKSIAGYGASMGCITLIHHFELGGVLDFLADDDARYHGLLSPGHHIPAYSTQSLYDRKPDYVVVMAWRQHKPIIAKHQKFLDDGGKFIVLYPELNVVSA